MGGLSSFVPEGILCLTIRSHHLGLAAVHATTGMKRTVSN